MSATYDMSVISLIANASILVKLVLGGLLLASLYSWYYIFLKILAFKRATSQADELSGNSGAAAILMNCFSAPMQRTITPVRWSVFSKPDSASFPS